MSGKFKGVGAALVTPFTQNGNVDYNALGRLLQFAADGGVDYFAVHGTTGEPFTTTAQEKAEIIQYIKEANPKKLPLMYGLGGNNTQSLLNELKGLDIEGIDAVLSVSPAYCLPTQEGIYQHYRSLADASPVPLVLYNVPGRTARNMNSETTLRLAEHENIIGIKEATKDMVQVMEIARNKPDDFMLISGDDMLTIPMISVGGCGAISVLANAFPSIFCEMVNQTLAGNYNKAQKAVFKLLDINNLLYCEGNPTGIKQVLSELEICGPDVRLPLIKASNNLIADLKISLAAILEE